WGDITMKVGMTAMQNRDEVGAASVDFLMYSGYVCLAYFWAQMVKVAQEKLASGTTETGFYTAKVQTAKFYYDRILPRTAAHAQMVLAGGESIMAIDEENFAF
ncbi:acyl-CoA dehydrogenase C-terminal domain-containing protein, partial [Oleiphilus sp. HI0079]